MSCSPVMYRRFVSGHLVSEVGEVQTRNIFHTVLRCECSIWFSTQWGRFRRRSLLCELEKLKPLCSVPPFVFLATQMTVLLDAFIWFPFTVSRNTRLPSEPTVCTALSYQLSVNLSTLDFCWPFKQLDLINGTQRGSTVKRTEL